MSLTPYDTGKRLEPELWLKEGDSLDRPAEDWGKVDFDDEESATVATLYIEKDADGSYALRGHTNQALKVEIDDQSDGDEPVAAPDEVRGISTIHWFPGDLVEWPHDDAYGTKVFDYGVVSGSERTLGMTTLWVYVPGHSKPRQWPAAQCRLLRRNSLNKEGQ
jgi:hypothetical protein